MEARPFERFLEEKPILTSEILMSRLYNVKLDRNEVSESFCKTLEVLQVVSGFPFG